MRPRRALAARSGLSRSCRITCARNKEKFTSFLKSHNQNRPPLNIMLPQQAGAAVGSGQRLSLGRRSGAGNARGSSGGGSGFCTKAGWKKVFHDLISKAEHLVDAGACGAQLNVWKQYRYTLCNYLSYKQGQWGAEAQGHFIGKIPHSPEHTAVVWFWRQRELKSVSGPQTKRIKKA